MNRLQNTFGLRSKVDDKLEFSSKNLTRRGPRVSTWELEDNIQKKYPAPFSPLCTPSEELALGSMSLVQRVKPRHVFHVYGRRLGCDIWYQWSQETPIITPTIPPSPDYTPASPDYLPASDSESNPSEDPSLDHIPPLPATSPFLSSINDTTDSDSPDTPPSPTHDHSSLDLPSTSAGQSRKRHRSPMTSVPALPLVSGALSPIRADLIPSPKRVKDSGYLTDVEVDPREISLRDDAIVKVSDKPHLEQDIDPEIHAEIDECIAYADALRDRGIDARVVVEAVDRDETETGVRGPVLEFERFHDHTQAIPVHRIQVVEGVQREQGHRIVGVESAVTALTERIAELERDNKRLRGTASVESQRVDRL
ncbi:hypothetical protein Tco_1111905 [Tanacetum coccineum]|uniref:Uncharacterized protein n=1 Tax=Tanacetum coccineum TaxID=301880 RepID=A0ABQ5IN40_9ASTR